MLWLSRINQWLQNAPSWFVVMLCMLVVILLGRVDAIIQPHASEDFLYVVAVAVAAWYVGRLAGIGIAAFAAVMWFVFSILDSQVSTSYFLRAWDAFSLLVIYLIVAFSISTLKKRMLQLDGFARLDSLTGLFNRRAFYESVAQEAIRSKRSHSTYTIAYIDVDDFKKVNDTYGHMGGDEVLVAISDVLKKGLRQTDTVARMGGDEFVLLLPDTDGEQARTAINKLFAHLNEVMQLKNLPVTFSIGVITYKNNPCSVDEMVKKADRLMYEIKSDMKNGIRFETDWSCDN
jgi:diguanylate cyclase (GGDEF)-like protein